MDTLDGTNRTPLHWACALGNADAVKILLKAHASDAVTDDPFNATPLHYAAIENRVECVKALVKRKGFHDLPDVDVSRVCVCVLACMFFSLPLRSYVSLCLLFFPTHSHLPPAGHIFSLTP